MSERAASLRTLLESAAGDAERLRAIVLAAVRESVQAARKADPRLASEATVIGLARTLQEAGAGAVGSVRLVASAVILAVQETQGDVGEAARGVMDGAARAAAELGSESVNVVSAAASASLETAESLGDETAQRVRNVLNPVAATAPHAGEAVKLEPETLSAFAGYISRAEAEFPQWLHSEGPFLWSDAPVKRAEDVRKGRILAQYWAGDQPSYVAKGMIHDWIGAVCIPGVTLERTLAVVQSYDRHKEIYRPEVIDSKLLSRSGDVFEIYLRLRKKKIITVVLDTDHHVEYVALGATCWSCRSSTTRIAEVEDAGKPDEKSRPPDTGHGFLWRLSSYWRFEQRAEGVWVECRAISLTRDVPKGLGWAIEPLISKLPRQSLIATLEATRRWCGRTD